MSIKSKHTPGPWHIEPEEWTKGRGTAICSKGGIVAIIDPEVCMSAEDRSNAKLIAKSPEFLSFVESIANMTTEEEFGDDRPDSEDWICTLNDLIESARNLLK